MRCTTPRPAVWSAATAAVLLLADHAAAQILGLRTLGGVTPTPPRAAMLRPSYQLRLDSAWPSPAGETAACNNRASESLEGSLRRVGANRYEGRFTRQTRLGFCGTHGTAVEPCGAVLRGEGDVGVVGRVTAGSDGRSVMTLVWQPIPGTTRIRIEGSCAPAFTHALGEMYRNAVHSVDFAVPDQGLKRVALEDYGRTLEIR
jgi:hypothetical protein